MSLALAMRPDARLRALEEEVKRLTAALEKEPLLKRIDRLEEENERLTQRLRQAELLIDVKSHAETRTPSGFMLTNQQLAIWRALNSHDVAPYEVLEAAIEYTAMNEAMRKRSPRHALKFQILLMRRKGARIRNIPRVGYALIRDAP